MTEKELTKSNRVRLKYLVKYYHLIYAILRRAICRRTKNRKEYTRTDLEYLCSEIECKDLGELKKLHKKWVGY